MVPDKLRMSIGTAGVLGLEKCLLDVNPTTAYLMTYTEKSCLANCAFCPQARESTSKKSLLSRVLWPVYEVNCVLEELRRCQSFFRRICIQTINYPSFFDDALMLLREIKNLTNLPVSLDTIPLSKYQMERFKEAGLERIGIPLDTATSELFKSLKGRHMRSPYRWDAHLKSLKTAVEVFGAGRVISNLIVGLGETEEEAARLIQWVKDLGIQIALFSFTPIPGTRLAGSIQPPIEKYRRIQFARFLISRGLASLENIEFQKDGVIVGFRVEDSIIHEALTNGEAFQTSGCPGCNRPFYNERPTGPIYNYPRKLTKEEALQEAMSIVLT